MINFVEDLAQTQDFKSLSIKAIHEFVALGRVKTVHKGSYLCMQDDLWPYMVYLHKGQLRWAILSVYGKEHVLYFIEPKHTFWGHTLVDGYPMPASLMASKQSEVMIWHGDDLYPFLNKNPEVLWSLVRYQAKTMRKAREVIYGLAFKPVAGRLARLLLDRMDETQGKKIKRDLTLHEIATIINSSQEVVCRILYQFQEEGLLSLDRLSIHIQDMSALQKIIEEE